jgi:hypothetical protein
MHRTYAFRGREEEDLLLAEHLAQYVVEGVLVTRAFGPWGERGSGEEGGARVRVSIKSLRPEIAKGREGRVGVLGGGPGPGCKMQFSAAHDSAVK